MKITIRNDFHNSETSIVVHPRRRDESEEWIPVKLRAGQVARARKALCGASGCTCSGPLGVRGPQLHDVAESHADGSTVYHITPYANI